MLKIERKYPAVTNFIKFIVIFFSALGFLTYEKMKPGIYDDKDQRANIKRDTLITDTARVKEKPRNLHNFGIEVDYNR